MTQQRPQFRRPPSSLDRLTSEDFEAPYQYQGPDNGTPEPSEQTPPGQPDIYTAHTGNQASKVAMIDQASLILNLLLGLMNIPGPGKQAPAQQSPAPSDTDVQRARQNSLGIFEDSNPLSDIYFGGPDLSGAPNGAYFGFPHPSPTSMTPSRPLWMAQAPALDPRLQQMLDQAEKGRQSGAAGGYFQGRPQQTPQAPVTPQPQGLPPTNQGETESQYIQRILKGN